MRQTFSKHCTAVTGIIAQAETHRQPGLGGAHGFREHILMPAYLDVNPSSPSVQICGFAEAM